MVVAGVRQVPSAGMPTGQVADETVGLVDLAPTFSGLAGRRNTGLDAGGAAAVDD